MNRCCKGFDNIIKYGDMIERKPAEDGKDYWMIQSIIIDYCPWCGHKFE